MTALHHVLVSYSYGLLVLVNLKVAYNPLISKSTGLLAREDTNTRHNIPKTAIEATLDDLEAIFSELRKAVAAHTGTSNLVRTLTR